MGDNSSVDENYLQEPDVEFNNDIVPIVDIDDSNTNNSLLTTTTLRRHIEGKHSNIYDRTKQTALEINSPHFNKFINLLNGRYKPPSLAFTTDIWSSMTNQSYLGITLHFIDDDWNLKNLTLDVIHLEDHHTGNIIADKVFNLLDEFNLTTKVLAFTTDNAANMLKFGENEQYLIADSVRHKLQIYWNLIKKNTRICSILDPHSKLRLFFNNADISEVNNDVKELITEHISNANNNSHNNNQYPISHHVYFYNLFTTNSDNSNTNDQNNIDEYNNYLNLPSISDNIK
ncbi:5608_t:CDS:2, partial [Entrophospora sp. SA101]